MKHRVFSIFDQAAAAFLPPSFLPTAEVAKRALLDAMRRDPEHQFALHAEQYTLFQIGVFDDASGLLTECEPEAICNLRVLMAGHPKSVDSVQKEKVS